MKIGKIDGVDYLKCPNLILNFFVEEIYIYEYMIFKSDLNELLWDSSLSMSLDIFWVCLCVCGFGIVLLSLYD